VHKECHIGEINSPSLNLESSSARSSAIARKYRVHKRHVRAAINMDSATTHGRDVVFEGGILNPNGGTSADTNGCTKLCTAALN
jgi:hypothetical protein